MATILIIDPDTAARTRMCEALEAAGHRCLLTENIAEGYEIARQSSRLLTILNARLSWAESFALLRLLEEKAWPLLFITADASTVRHLHALYQGPRGVLLAPYDGNQLRHSVAMLLSETNSQLTLGALRMDVENRECTLDGDLLTLTAQEFSLLQALMESPDSPLTREELLRTAWGYHSAGETRTVDVHIQRLRRKLGTSCIETVYKLGYRLKMA
ncbi:MAG: response regulator transcription factor [Clostridiales bacterium]|nr:response regulator transcription factor [Clostridiales bacterium]